MILLSTLPEDVVYSGDCRLVFDTQHQLETQIMYSAFDAAVGALTPTKVDTGTWRELRIVHQPELAIKEMGFSSYPEPDYILGASGTGLYLYILRSELDDIKSMDHLHLLFFDINQHPTWEISIRIGGLRRTPMAMWHIPTYTLPGAISNENDLHIVPLLTQDLEPLLDKRWYFRHQYTTK